MATTTTTARQTEPAGSRQQAGSRRRAGVPVGQIPDYVWPDCSRSLEATNETSSMHHHSMARLLRNNIDMDSDSSRKPDSTRLCECWQARIVVLSTLSSTALYNSTTPPSSLTSFTLLLRRRCGAPWRRRAARLSSILTHCSTATLK